MPMQARSPSGVAAFVEQVSQGYFPYEIMRVDDAAKFRGDIETRRVGRTSISHAYANSSFTGRVAPSQGDHEAIVLHWVVAGDLEFVQDRRHSIAKRGDMILLKSDKPLMSCQRGAARALALSIPARLLRGRYQDIDDWCLLPRPTHEGVGAVLRSALKSYWDQSLVLGRDQEAPVCSWLFDLLAATFVPQTAPAATDSMARHFRRVEEIVAGMLDDPDLSIDSVAMMMGVSRSYMFAIMSSAGTTFGRYLLEQRLLRSATLLEKQGGARVGEVASNVGFRSLAHFSRSFAHRFGSPPRAFSYLQRKANVS